MSVLLLSGSEDGSAVLWSEDGSRLASFSHGAPVHGVDVSSDTSGRLCSASLNGQAVVWDCSGEQFRISHKSGVRAVCWAMDRIWTGDTKGHIQCSDASGGSSLHIWPAHDAAIGDIAFSSIARPMLFTGGRDGKLEAWDGEILQSLISWQADSGGVNAIATDQTLVAAGGIDAVIRIYDARTSEKVGDLGSGTHWSKALQSTSSVSTAAKVVSASEGHAFAVTGVSFVDGVTVASSAADRKILIWDLRKLGCVIHCVGHDLAALAVVSANGRIFSSSDDMSIREWSLQGASVNIRLDIHEGPIFALRAKPG
eukprot:TRINITY_DN78218_c0_g1_i1.p1 TRINITY_DN78218_c0_g1~~TRINITY_DN78218_c0_g1_i1.p1  ORF type:complete len:312 (+),score=47.76 TRINITY_DN78218_c0_g1_i1:143-1078(+)